MPERRGTIRQSLKGRARLSDAVLIVSAIIAAAGSIALWDWGFHIYALGRPHNFCPDCGLNFDNPQY